MSKVTHTTRRSFLKSGAMVAAPIAAVAAPAVAFADDGARARLARLEDQQAIDLLNRDFFRRFNAGGKERAAELFAGGGRPNVPTGVARLTPDLQDFPEEPELSEDGMRATCRYACSAEVEHRLEGNETVVQMARLQGNPAARTTEARTLHTQYVKLESGWAIESAHLA